MTDFTKFDGSTHPIVKLEDDWNNLLDHGLEKGISYIIRKNGSYYEALDGSTGKIAYGGSASVGADGTDASAVIQATIDALPNVDEAVSGGTIFVKNGIYTLPTVITIDRPLSFQGEFSGTPEIGASSKPRLGTWFKAGVVGMTLFQIKRLDYILTSVQMKHFAMGYGTPWYGIVLGDSATDTYVNDIVLDDLSFVNIGKTAIEIKPAIGVHMQHIYCGYGGSIDTDTAMINVEGSADAYHSNVIELSEFRLTKHANTALKLDRAGCVNIHDGYIESNKKGLVLKGQKLIEIENVWFENNEDAQVSVEPTVYAEEAPNTLTFKNNHFGYVGVGGGPQFIHSVATKWLNVKFERTRFAIGADESAGSLGWVDTGQLLLEQTRKYSAGTGWADIPVGTRAILDDLVVTEHSGTAEASNTDVVPFGVTFNVAPTSVTITVNESDARYIAQAYSITTTGFTLYLWDDTAGELETTDKTISWHAEYT